MEEYRNSGKFPGRSAVLGTILAILLIAGGYLFFTFDLAGMLKSYLESHIHPGLFIALMAFLPVFGVPINPFLVLVGMKFGIYGGVLLSGVLMSFHMAFTYILVHFVFRDRVARLLARFKVSLPTVLAGYTLWQVIVFMLVPGVPYAVKNNLLALAGYRFAPYMAINWSTQYGHGIPMIVLGGAVVEMEFAILGIALALLVLGFLLQRYLKRRFAGRGRGGAEE